MKNLKRALSLVLSTAMLLGMMVVGTGAATHSDVEAEHNVEAIEVVTAAGIMGANETFAPDSYITRNEMAVVMVNMLGLDKDAFAGACPYTEAAWAQSYVDAVYANSIMSGDGVSFNGGANVTLVEAALMMMKALGYFQTAGDFEGGWDTATIKKAAEIKLLNGVNAKSTDKLTRNQVAQLCLNALEQPTVHVENSNSTTTSITAGDVKVEITGKNSYEKNTNDVQYTDEYAADEDEYEYEYLIEVLFEDIKKYTDDGDYSVNALGLDGECWVNDKEDEEIVFTAKEAYKVVVADADGSVEDLYKDKVDKKYNKAAIAGTANSGDVVYYYRDSDKNVTATVVEYELVQIAEVDDEIRAADKKDGVEAYIDIVGGLTGVKSTDFAGFDAETYVEDAWVLVSYDVDDASVIAASELAEIVEGKITATKGGEYKIGGTYYAAIDGYESADDAASLARKSTVKVVLNKAEQIAYVLKATEEFSEDFIYIYDYDVNADGYRNEDGVQVDETVLTVWGVLADGSKVKYVVADGEDYVELDGEEYVCTLNKVEAYSIDDGELVIEDTELVVDYENAKLDKDNDSIGSVFATNNTEFVFAAVNSKDKMVVTTATGYKNVNIAATDDIAVIYDADDEDMLLVFVFAAAEELDADVEYAVLLDNEVIDETDADDDAVTIYTYNVLINGKETTLSTKDVDIFDDLVVGAPFAYEMDGKYVDADSIEVLTTVETIDRVGEDFIVIDGTRYDMEDAADFTLTYVFEEEADAESILFDDVEELNMSTSANLKKDAKVIVDYNDAEDEVLAIFVIKASR